MNLPVLLAQAGPVEQIAHTFGANVPALVANAISYDRRPTPMPARKAAALGGLLTGIGYCLLAGFGIPAQRTLYMLGIAAIALLADRTQSASRVLAMALLAVEISDNLAAVGPVLIGVVAATLVVRHAFGYSFATWRFHLRGEAILSGEDIGWRRDTAARGLMRRDVPIVPTEQTVAAFGQCYPPGVAKHVIAVDDLGNFAGFVDLARIYAELSPAVADDEPSTLSGYLVAVDGWVPANLSIDRVLPMFELRETEALAVVETDEDHHVLGLITEAYALKQYRLELEARQKEMFGQ